MQVKFQVPSSTGQKERMLSAGGVGSDQMKNG